MFKKALKAAAFAAALALPGFAFAQAAPAPDAKPADAKPEEPKSPHTLTGNFGVYSQYIFRGLTQTGHKPAAQGGFDYSHESGLYAGTWLSNISWLKENASTPAAVGGTYGEGGSLEMDFYGGYKWALPHDFLIDFGTLYYYYPGSVNNVSATVPAGTPKADTWEIYISPSWKWLSFKTSYSVKSEVFGNLDAKGTLYYDVSANVPLGDVLSKSLDGLTFIAHWGYQKYKGTGANNATAGVGGPILSNDTLFSYKDAKLGLSYALPKDFTIGAYWTKLYNYNKAGYGGTGDALTGLSAVTGPYPNDIGKSTGTAYIQKTF